MLLDVVGCCNVALTGWDWLVGGFMWFSQVFFFLFILVVNVLLVHVSLFTNEENWVQDQKVWTGGEVCVICRIVLKVKDTRWKEK